MATVALAVAVCTGGAVAFAPSADAAPINASTNVLATVAPGSTAPTFSGATSNASGSPDETVITLHAARTILDVTNFNLEAADTLDLVFDDPDDIVLIRMPGFSTLSVAGKINASLTSVDGAQGGNVWLAAQGGVSFPSTSRVEVGGMLATSDTITDANFLDGDLQFPFALTGYTTVSLDGAHLTGQGSFMGFVAQAVSQTAGSVVDGGTAAPEVLYGAATAYTLTLAEKPAGGFDLLAFAPDAAIANSLTLAGSTSAASVFVAGTVSPTLGPPTADAPPVITANGTVADGDGQIAIGAGWGVGRSSSSQPMGMLPLAGAAASDLAVGVPLSAPGALLLAANRSLSLSAPVSGLTVGLSTGSGPNGEPGSLNGTFSRTAAGTVTAADHWVVYAQYPADVPTGATALATTSPVIWKSDVISAPPGTVTGNRYVFRFSPRVMFDADDIEKEYGEEATLTFTQTDGPQPGLAGVYPADPPFVGTPALTSDGAAADAPYLPPPRRYSIELHPGSLVEPPGYTFGYDSGRLTILDSRPPTVGAATATVDGGGAYSEGTWTNKDVSVTWTCTDPASGPLDAAPSQLVQTSTTVTPGCDDLNENHADGTPFQVTIDKTAPVLSGVPANQTVTTTGTSAVVTWTAPTATDDQASSPTVACAPPSGSSFPLGQTTVTCSATDAAGNVTTRTFTVTVNQAAPPVVVTMRTPIDPAPVMNTAKVARIVPIRTTFTLSGRQITGSSAQPLSVGAPQKVSCGVSTRTDAVETFASSGTSGNLFRWNSSLKRWVFNFDQRAFGLTAGNCYRVPVLYGGTVVRNEASGGSQVGFLYLRSLK